jgi:hypothetical protein
MVRCDALQCVVPSYRQYALAVGKGRMELLSEGVDWLLHRGGWLGLGVLWNGGKGRRV